MMNVTHTPGPWVLDGPGTEHLLGDGYHCINSAGLYSYAVMSVSGFLLDADAVLIAASPDLLAALQAMVAHYPAGINTMLDEASIASRAAIARATGAAP